MGLFNKGELKDVEQAVLQKIMHSEFLGQYRTEKSARYRQV